MISICIPVFNTDVNKLVNSLAREIEQHHLSCEIVVLDDGSDLTWQDANQAITKINSVSYHQFSINEGRVKARKKLATLARYEWLLYIDADSTIKNNRFLSTYLAYCTDKNDVVVGGRVYLSTPPADCSQTLHWTYGRKRETFIESRFNFMSNNFCIRKSIFLNLSFPDVLKGYGHEDTWMGIQLKGAHAKLLQIPNPVLHEGLEKTEVFISKSKNALQNLWVLQELVPTGTLQQHVKLFRYHALQKKLGLSGLIQWIEKAFHNQIQKNLNSCKPSLLLFDFFRLAYFISLDKNLSLHKD